MVVALAVAAEADPAVREVTDDHAGDPGDGDGDEWRGQAAVSEAEVDRLTAERDQRANDSVADQLGEGFARLGVGEDALDMAFHLRSRASTDALAMAIGLTSRVGIKRTAAR